MESYQDGFDAGIVEGERLDILLSPYWAHVGVSGENRIAEFRHTEASGKSRLIYSWNLEQVANLGDRSRQWQVRRSGDRLVQTSIQEAQEGGSDQVQYTHTRLATTPPPLDGVWVVQLDDITTRTRLFDGLTLIRYGGYIGLFRQRPGGRLEARVIRTTAPGQWNVIFSTEKAEADGVVNHCQDCGALQNRDGWHMTWINAEEIATGAMRVPKGDRLRATLSRFDLGATARR